MVLIIIMVSKYLSIQDNKSFVTIRIKCISQNRKLPSINLVFYKIYANSLIYSINVLYVFLEEECFFWVFNVGVTQYVRRVLI